MGAFFTDTQSPIQETMKRLSLLISLPCVLALACSLPGLGLSPSLTTPAPASATARPASAPILVAPTLKRLPTSQPSPTSTPTLIVSTASPDYTYEEEQVFITPQETPLPPSLINVTYCTMDGVELKMDAYFPSERSPSMPVVVYVHGGGWAAGDKRGGPGAVETPALVNAGFAVFSINYRLAPEFLFPAMIEDVKCAIRSLRAHAADYQIDPNRIGVWGGSAGGHLVSLLGTADESAGFDVGEYLEYSSRAQAVVNMYGPTDLTVPMTTNQQLQLLMNAFPPNLYAAGSPVTYVSPDDPPFLVLHGNQDKLVPVEQAYILNVRLAEKGVPVTLVIVQNAGHGFEPVGGEIMPSRAEITQMVLDFFSQTLK